MLFVLCKLYFLRWVVVVGGWWLLVVVGGGGWWWWCKYIRYNIYAVVYC